MSRDAHAVVLVYSVSHAIRTEKILKGLEISCKLIPVPRHLSSDCGVCVRISQDHEQAVLQALESARQEIEGCHHI